MRQRARHPARLQFVVLDNNSIESHTRQALSRLKADGVSIITVDQPFNWSRLNNIGAAATDATLLVFANNDVEMITTDWDVVLAGTLAAYGGAVIGARLLYPDRRYQHAGVLLGVRPDHPVTHEALLHPESDNGPDRRWVTRRSASAVTGAFMAATRRTFDEIGGFDERLPVAYNDIDFCLRVRSAGGRVVYEPNITLLHHESVTRGRNVSAEQVAWDNAEMRHFSRSWTNPFSDDPSYNPQWSRGGEPFDGFREPDIAEIDRWIARQRDGQGWSAQRR